MQTAYAKDGHLHVANIIAEPMTTISVVKLQNSRCRGLSLQVCAEKSINASDRRLSASGTANAPSSWPPGRCPTMPSLRTPIDCMFVLRNCSDTRSYSVIPIFSERLDSAVGARASLQGTRDVLNNVTREDTPMRTLQHMSWQAQDAHRCEFAYFSKSTTIVPPRKRLVWEARWLRLWRPEERHVEIDLRLTGAIPRGGPPKNYPEVYQIS